MKTKKLMGNRQESAQDVKNQTLETKPVISGLVSRQKKMLIIAVGPDELLKTKDEKFRARVEPDYLLKTFELSKKNEPSRNVIESKTSYEPLRARITCLGTFSATDCFRPPRGLGRDCSSQNVTSGKVFATK